MYTPWCTPILSTVLYPDWFTWQLYFEVVPWFAYHESLGFKPSRYSYVVNLWAVAHSQLSLFTDLGSVNS